MFITNMIETGKRIKEIRVGAQMTQEEFGNCFYVSANAVGKWERGESLPEYSKLVDIALTFNTNVNDIVVGIYTKNTLKEKLNGRT